MPIPPFEKSGLLPQGVHSCTLEEIKARFGSFQANDRRPHLFAGLEAFVAEARRSQIVRAIVVDGSFVTAKPAPNDIDLVIVVASAHDFGADLPPDQYQVLAQQRVRRRFGFDIVVVKEGSDNFDQAVVFFSRVRQHPGVVKGLLRMNL